VADNYLKIKEKAVLIRTDRNDHKELTRIVKYVDNSVDVLFRKNDKFYRELP
jgi:arsenate reductase-like glutaredoxin family protein